MDIYFEIITWLILLHNMAITFEYLPIHDYHGLYMGLKHFIFIGVYNWHILKIQMVRAYYDQIYNNTLGPATT